MQGNLGNVSRQFLFGFSQPYIRNRPINVGFQIFNNKQDFNAAKNYQATTGAGAEPDRGAAVADAELQPGVDGTELLGQLSAEASRLPAAGLHLFADQVDDLRIQHRIADLLPDHLVPVGHPGHATRWRASSSSTASFSYIYNTINNPLRPAHRQGVHGGVSGRRPLRKRSLHLAAGGVQELPVDALPEARGQRAQCARPARAAGLRAGIRRRRGAAAEPLLHRRRRGSARLRRSRRNALWLRAQPRDNAVDQSGRHLRSARSRPIRS